MKHLILSLAILSIMTLQASADIKSAIIKDILIRYDDERFAISDRWSAGTGSSEETGEPIRLVFGCAAPVRCLDDPVLVVTAAPSNDEETTPLVSLLDPGLRNRGRIQPLWGPSDESIDYGVSASRDFGGLSLTGTIRHSRCRGRAPSEIDASGEHAGIRYRFSSGLTHLCGGIEGFSREMFEEFLGGITVISQE